MDSQEVIYRWMDVNEVGLPTLMDAGETLYNSYGGVEGAYAPFPVQVVIDQHGVTRYLSGQYDADAVRTTIQELLDAE